MARAAVEWFAGRMEEKLRRNDGVKVPWVIEIPYAMNALPVGRSAAKKAS